MTFEDDLRAAVDAAAGRPEVVAAVEAVYADLAKDVAERRPVCVVSGRCCRFEEYGHRLYVTTIELAAFAAGLDRKPVEAWDGTGCPYQFAKLCGVHAIRPFGCRVYFCDATARQWQEEAYERYHARLKRLHDEMGVPYFYVEWRGALRVIIEEVERGA